MNKNNDEIIYFFEEVYQYTVNNFKKNSKFKPDDLYFKIRHLQIDARGSFGQKFIMYGLKKMDLKQEMMMIKTKIGILNLKIIESKLKSLL